MSTSMYWRPVPKVQPPVETADYALKKIMAPRLWGHDGSLHGSEVLLDCGYVPYLEGLADAGVDGAAMLLAAVRDYGAVTIWIES